LDVFLERTEHARFRGCRYAAADLGLPDPAHPVHAQTRAYYDHVRGLVVAELAAIGHPDPESGADRIHLLIDGALAQRGTRSAQGTAAAARALFDLVLAETPRKGDQ
jgi:hypothetical protein